MTTPGLPAVSKFLPPGFQSVSRQRDAEALAFAAMKQIGMQALAAPSSLLPPGMGGGISPSGAPPLGAPTGMLPPGGGLQAPVPGGRGAPPAPPMPPLSAAGGALPPGPATLPGPMGAPYHPSAPAPTSFATGGQVDAASAPLPGTRTAPPALLTADELIGYVQALAQAQQEGRDPAAVPMPGGGMRDGMGAAMAGDMAAMGAPPGPMDAGMAPLADDDGETDLRALADAEPAPARFVAWLDAGDPGEPADVSADVLDLYRQDPGQAGLLYQIVKGIAADEPDGLPPALLRAIGKPTPTSAFAAPMGNVPPRRPAARSLLPPGMRKAG